MRACAFDKAAAPTKACRRLNAGKPISWYFVHCFYFFQIEYNITKTANHRIAIGQTPLTYRSSLSSTPGLRTALFRDGPAVSTADSNVKPGALRVRLERGFRVRTSAIASRVKHVIVVRINREKIRKHTRTESRAH